MFFFLRRIPFKLIAVPPGVIPISPCLSEVVVPFCYPEENNKMIGVLPVSVFKKSGVRESLRLLLTLILPPT